MFLIIHPVVHFVRAVVRLRLMNATYWFVSARSVPGNRPHLRMRELVYGAVPHRYHVCFTGLYQFNRKF